MNVIDYLIYNNNKLRSYSLVNVVKYVNLRFKSYL